MISNASNTLQQLRCTGMVRKVVLSVLLIHYWTDCVCIPKMNQVIILSTHTQFILLKVDVQILFNLSFKLGLRVTLATQRLQQEIVVLLRQHLESFIHF